MFQFTEHSHKRFNPLTRSYILVSPHRAKRPWLGQQEEIQADNRPGYDPKCYLCPGNSRVDGSTRNPDYKSTFTFQNDFPAVQSNVPAGQSKVSADKNDKEQDLFRFESMRGECMVICFHPLHNLTIAKMTVTQILPVISEWVKLYTSYVEKPLVDISSGDYRVNYVQIFENKGEMMGCSNPHPHGQVWCLEKIPEEPLIEYYSLLQYYQKHGSHMLVDYVNFELSKPEERIVYQNAEFVCLVPFWATWPFETMILSKKQKRSFLDFTEQDHQLLADVLRVLACKYDNLFKCSFPYSMGIHQAPSMPHIAMQDVDLSSVLDEMDPQSSTAAPWMTAVSHFHIHAYPPLLRSATVRKFLVGFEMLGMPQRDLTAEQAAARLRNLPETHSSLVKE
ncbi:hypothetical protein MP228_001750 [Amoeboaphelidium protococcarum]|nr:hypothetical protein MP228_001750 [Amoeboaphelidium protococcarum]